jgi:hypothetical protein
MNIMPNFDADKIKRNILFVKDLLPKPVNRITAGLIAAGLAMLSPELWLWIFSLIERAFSITLSYSVDPLYGLLIIFAALIFNLVHHALSEFSHFFENQSRIRADQESFGVILTAGELMKVRQYVYDMSSYLSADRLQLDALRNLSQLTNRDIKAFHDKNLEREYLQLIECLNSFRSFWSNNSWDERSSDEAHLDPIYYFQRDMQMAAECGTGGSGAAFNVLEKELIQKAEKVEQAIASFVNLAKTSLRLPLHAPLLHNRKNLK